jgi:hypothetical protein
MKMLWACIIRIRETAASTSAGSPLLIALSSPQSEASEPLMRASPVRGLAENRAPVAGDPSYWPV